MAPDQSDYSGNEDDALKRARENGDGKTIDGEWVRAAHPGSGDANAGDANDDDDADGTRYVGGTPGSGPDDQPDDDEQDSTKPPKPDPDDIPEHIRKHMKNRNTIGSLRDAWLGLHNNGDYFRIRPQQPNGPGPKEISDKQLREILMRCVLEKGWNKIYFYNGNKPDLNTHRRASEMLAVLTRPPKDPSNPNSLTGPLYEIAQAWREVQQAKEAEYKQAVKAYEESGGKTAKPDLPSNVLLEAVQGRMDPGDLPKCFNPERHERMRAREEKRERRNQDRMGNKERAAKRGFN